jgi:hypothetical protein
MWGTNGIIPLLDFSPFDWTCLDSNVLLISLETFSNHWNHFQRSSSKVCKIGQNTWEVTCQFSYSCKVFPLLDLSKVEGQFRVRLGSDMVSHHLVRVEVHRTRIDENGYVSHMPLCICGVWFLIWLGLTQLMLLSVEMVYRSDPTIQFQVLGSRSSISQIWYFALICLYGIITFFLKSFVSFWIGLEKY